MSKTKTLRLSPVDHVFTGRDSYSVEFLSVYPYRIDGERLRAALEKTARKFWPVRSELKRVENNFYEFSESAAALDFSWREGGKTLPSFQNPKELGDFSDAVHSLPGERLARFRLTHIGQYSIFVANLSHAMVDGYSYFFFLSVLAANYRYSLFDPQYWKTQLIHPDLDRSKLQPRTEQVTARASADVNPEEFFRRTGFSYAGIRTLPALADSRWQFIRFEPAELTAYLRQADGMVQERLSKHDVITALLWKRIAQDWHTKEDVLECSSAFDYRRIHGGLSPMYWGNAVRGTTARIARSDILNMTVPELAAAIRLSTRAINRDAVLDSLTYMNEMRHLHGPEVFQRGQIAHPERGLLVTNLSRIDAKRLDFGKGPPNVVIPLTAAPRAAVLLSDGETVVARLGLPQ